MITSRARRSAIGKDRRVLVGSKVGLQELQVRLATLFKSKLYPRFCRGGNPGIHVVPHTENDA
jgi:hypothetical protein